MQHKSFGLVLAGGGARGMAHVGALRALNHHGYFPSVVAGVSIGALVAATYSLNLVSGFERDGRIGLPSPASVQNAWPKGKDQRFRIGWA